jgi:hypothetical protein
MSGGGLDGSKNLWAKAFGCFSMMGLVAACGASLDEETARHANHPAMVATMKAQTSQT